MESGKKIQLVAATLPSSFAGECTAKMPRLNLDGEKGWSGPEVDASAYDNIGELYVTASAPFAFALKSLPANAYIDTQRAIHKLPGSDMRIECTEHPQLGMDLVAVPRKAFAQCATLLQMEAQAVRQAGSTQIGILPNLAFDNFNFLATKIGESSDLFSLQTAAGDYAHMLPAELAGGSTHRGIPGQNLVFCVAPRLSSSNYLTAQWRAVHVPSDSTDRSEQRYVLWNRGTNTCIELASRNPQSAYIQARGDLPNETQRITFLNTYGIPIIRITGAKKLEEAMCSESSHFFIRAI